VAIISCIICDFHRLLTQNGGIPSTQAEIAPQYKVWKL